MRLLRLDSMSSAVSLYIAAVVLMKMYTLCIQGRCSLHRILVFLTELNICITFPLHVVVVQ